MVISPRDAQSPEILSLTQCLRALEQPLRFIKGIGPKRAADLESIGLTTVEDLLFHLPFRYEDRRAIQQIRDTVAGTTTTCIGRLSKLKKQFNPRRRAQMLSAGLSDETGVLSLLWYRAPGYLVDRLPEGARLLVHGRIEIDLRGGKRIVHPDFEVLDDATAAQLERILPVYLHPAGVPLSLLRKWIVQALAEYGSSLPSLLPPATIERQELLSPPAALIELHQPSPVSDMAALNASASCAHRSVIFEELFYLQLGLALRKRGRAAGRGVQLSSARRDFVPAMRRLLPFKLTGAQERVLSEIQQDMSAARAMQRLVQGDVGAGKTMVAWFASLRAIESGCQAVWMAPTELLAEQHFRNIARICRGFENQSRAANRLVNCYREESCFGRC